MATDSLQQLNVEDGTYTIEVSLEGGSGKATVQSPCALEVENHEGNATIIWSSPNYDYMIVGGKKLLPINDEGDSVFVVPVSVYDSPMEVVADTTAMSVPHEIEYTLTFDTTTLADKGGTPVELNAGKSATDGVYFAILIAALAIGALALTKRVLKRKAKKVE